jgi:hypothetical protein
LLAKSLPSQSSYILQIIFVSTIGLQGLDLLRVYPLTLALIRKCVGPNFMAEERERRMGSSTRWKTLRNSATRKLPHSFLRVLYDNPCYELVHLCGLRYLRDWIKISTPDHGASVGRDLFRYSS